MPISRERKQAYFARLVSYLDEYNKVFVVQADHVSSLQFAQIRKALRNEAQVLMGKNTMMRKVLTQYVRDHPGHPYELLIPKIRGNMGFIFTNNDLGKVRSIVQDCDVPAPARAGVIAPVDVKVPPGPTGCDPGQTAWFQALNVPTKISRGQIEIVSEMSLIGKGEKVGPSQAALLQKLNIKPFTYGLAISHVYDNGSLFDAAVLDLTDDDLIRKFVNGMNHIAAISLEVGYPTEVALPHYIGNAFKRAVQICLEIDYCFPAAEQYKAFLSMSPEELAALKAAAGGGGGGDAAAEEAPAEEEEEEEADVGAGGLFGGDDDGY